MSRFRKISHAIWHCQYHIVWIPKYRYKVMTGPLSETISGTLRAIAGWMKCEVLELKVMPDHVHMVIMAPPTVSISKLMGELKGRTAIRVFQKFPALRYKTYYGNHFWANGYCVDTVGLNEEMIRKYVQYQEEKERKEEAQIKLGI